ncbi:MAG: ABC transporter permease, partial [Planktomarina sp.]|jgi:spermidine/putrescine transport system permease protein|nr:ABC transporter permease [Planktomarina sp.]
VTPRSIKIALFMIIATVPFLFVVVPISAFLIMSFWQMDGAQIVREFSVSNYVDFFTNDSYLRTFLNTLWLCSRVTAVGILIGYPIAWFIWKREKRAGSLLLLLFAMPLFMSYIVKIYTMRSILGLNGFLNKILVGVGILDTPSLVFLYNQTAILITMSVVFLPFAILPIYLSLDRIPQSLLHASADLGASSGVTFRHVVIPLSLPGTVAGALFVFILALGDFITPQMVGGPSGFTIGRVIWSQFGLAYNWPFGAAMGAVLFLLALLLIVAAAFAASRQKV